MSEEAVPQGRCALDDYRVVELAVGVPGGYCGKLLADAGATVTKLEPPSGDPLRRWSASGVPLEPGDDGPLFQYLAASKQSIVVDPTRYGDVERAEAVLAEAEAVVWSADAELGATPSFSPDRLRELAPQASIVTISPFGLRTSWSGRPTNEFILQALSGSIADRGSPDRPPVVAGARLGDWVTGMVAGLSLLIARWRSLRTGNGELVDLSALEAHMLTLSMYPVTHHTMSGRSLKDVRSRNFPDVEVTRDGLVGLMTGTGQQWLDFCAMVDRPEWAADELLISLRNRMVRRAELAPAVSEWMASHTTEEVLELAAAFRIPAAPIGNGANVVGFEHFVEGDFFVRNPRGGFLQPNGPFRFHNDITPRSVGSAPRLGEHAEIARAGSPETKPAAATGPTNGLPFAGLRVADFTCFWAGPLAGNILGHFGADVIHVESTARMDGMRYSSVRGLDHPEWWEWSPLFHGPNTNKRDLTLDMSAARGRELALELIATCDVVIENYSPRVFDAWGLGYEELRAVSPDIILVRGPAFGLRGPWRDRTGYAQTQEQVSGLAWLTGYPDEEPQVPNGACDPIAGCHLAIALLLALEHRRKTGRGGLVEVPMVASALQLAAEQVVEHSANGVVLGRAGNRSAVAVPQGLYRTGDTPGERWVAISVEDDVQWRALVEVLGATKWMDAPDVASREGRHRLHDEIDRVLAGWCEKRLAADITGELGALGIPCGKVMLDFEQADLVPVRERGFFEQVDHPVTGSSLVAGFPARFQLGPHRLQRRPAPTLGQHNAEILAELGLGPDEVRQLEVDGIIGTRPS